MRTERYPESTLRHRRYSDEPHGLSLPGALGCDVAVCRVQHFDDFIPAVLDLRCS